MPLTLSGTNGVSGVDGSASTPSLRGSDLTGNGIVYGTDTVQIATGGTTAVTVDSSQRVGFGATPNASYAGWQTVQVGNGQIVNAAEQFKILGNCYLNSAGASWIYASSSNATRYEVNVGGQHQWFTSASGTAGNAISWTQAMTLDASGNLLVGTTGAAGTSSLNVVRPANTANYIYMLKNTQVEMTMGCKASTDTNFYIGSGSSAIGTYGVYLANAGSSWNAVSDERKKTIIEDIDDAINKVDTLRTVIGYYNNDEKKTRRPFLIAQDVQAVLPEAVTIADEETQTLGLSYTDVIPLLTSAIKELSAKLDAAEARIAALEAK